MSEMWTGTFWAAVLERSLKTSAQAGALALGTFILTDVDQVLPMGRTVLLAMLTGALLSVLTSIASAPISGDGPSLGPELLAGHTKPADVGLGILGEDDGA